VIRKTHRVTDTNLDGQQLIPRWGGLGTALWGLVLAGIYIIVSTITYSAIVLSRHPGASGERFTELILENVNNGYFLAIAIIAAAIAVIPLLIGVVKLKRESKISDYLAIQSVPKKIILKWVLIALALGIVFDVLKLILGLELIPSFSIDTYQTKGNPWIFFPAVVLIVPLIEESFFRGFLISGFERTFLGSIGAVVVTAAIWAAIHTQYNLFDIVSIFVLGCVVGMSRVLTGSIYPALATHITINAFAYVMVAVYVEQFPT